MKQLSPSAKLLTNLIGASRLYDPSKPLGRDIQAYGVEISVMVLSGLLTFQHGVALLRARKRLKKSSVSDLSGINSPAVVQIGVTLVKAGLLPAIDVLDLFVSDPHFQTLYREDCQQSEVHAKLRALAAKSIDRLLKKGLIPLPQAQVLCEQILAAETQSKIPGVASPPLHIALPQSNPALR